MRILVTSYFCFVFLSVSAQSVDRNDIVISVTPGASLNYFGSDSTGPFHPSASYWGIRTPVSVEYAFSRIASLSLDVNYNRMFVGTMHRSNFTILDFGIGIRWHSPSSKRRINWFGETAIHYSKLHYFFHGDFTHENTNAKGWCLFYDVGANVPLSANQKFGMGLSLNGSAYKYRKANYSNDLGGQALFGMNAMSFALGINFYYKL